MESRALVTQKWEFPLEGRGQDLRIAGDGNLFAVGGTREGAGFVSLVDKAGKALWRYITREPISTVAISDVGGFVAAGCDDSQVYFFDRRGLLLWRYKCDRRITAVGVSRDGNTLAAGSEDFGVYYFDNRNTPRRFVWKLRVEGVVSALAIVPSGENVLAGSQDGGIYFMDAREGNVVWKTFARAPVNTVAVSKFADVMAAGSDDGSVLCFDFGGRLLWERQTAGGIMEVSIDNRGAFVAALSKDGTLYFFEAKGGGLLWSHPVGSPEGQVKLAKNGDLVFVLTKDSRFLCLSAAEGVVFEARAGSEAVAFDVSADTETLALLERGVLRVFETKTVFKSLIMSLRQYILKARERGADITAALNHEKTAVGALKNFDYKGVHANVVAAEGALRGALAKLSEDSEVQRRAREALQQLEQTTKDGRAAGFDTGAVAQVVEAAAKAVEAREFGKALSIVQDARGKVQDLQRKREAFEKAKHQIEGAAYAVERALQFNGVNVKEADAQLRTAEDAMKERNFSMAAEYASLAHEMVLHARRSSPKAIEAEVREIREKLHGGHLQMADAAILEGGLQNAIAYYAGARSFKELGAAFELLDTLWTQQAKLKGQPSSAKHALEAAAFAYLDAGDAARAAEIAERALDYKFAAKLRERLKQPEEAQRVLNRLGADRSARRTEMASEGRKVDDYIGSLISAKKYVQAAAELCRFDRYAEAVSLLEAQRDPTGVAFLLRICFHLGQYDRMVATASAAEVALREEVQRGNAELLPFLGRLLTGHSFLAEVMGYTTEQDRVTEGWTAFLAEHERLGRDGPDRDADAAAVLAWLSRGERAKVRALSQARQGPFYDWLRDAEVMIERGNLKGFRKMLSLFERDFVGRSVHMGSQLKSLLPPSNAADALDELFPFNLNGQLLELYRLSVNEDFLRRLLAKGDQLLAAKEYEKALPYFREVLAKDPFGTCNRVQVAARVTGIYLARGGREAADRTIAELGLDAHAVLSEVAKLPGLAGIETPVVAPARASNGEGKRCPNCGELVPKVAVRCFRCGSPIR
jgi:outer membrane protein assembly factor BamB